MSDDEMRTVGEAAALLGVSVRTLHYWEEKGILTPAYRSWADYRLYTPDDLLRGQQILIYRAAGMALEDIGKLLASPDTALTHLRRQRQLLTEKERALTTMIGALDRLLEEAMTGKNLTPEQIAEIIDDADFPAYLEEAQEKWGDSKDWAIAQQRQAEMSGHDWDQLKTDTADIEQRLAAAMRAGVAPGSQEANRLAEEHRALLSTFFPVSPAKHVLLARGYMADQRFVDHYDAHAPGLTAWLQQVINANAKAQGIDPDSAQWE